MMRPRKLILLVLAAAFLMAAQAKAEPSSAMPPIDPKVKAEMKALYAKIKTDREFLKGEREKLKPVVERLKANNAKMKAMREKVKAQRDALRGAQPQGENRPAGIEDDPLDDILAPQ